MIVIDIIEYCNFKCYFCKAKDITEPRFMNLDLFKKIILEAKNLGIKEIDLIPAKGDPFLHPDIYEILAFVNEHMKRTVLFTNATPINIRKLKKTPLNNIQLCVSYYGSTTEKFKELTGMDKNLFDMVHKKIKAMDRHGIPYSLERRDYGYRFSVPGEKFTDNLDTEVKCHFHTMPKILANGDVVFCKFIKENIPHSEGIVFANLNTVSLKEALEDPIRYKFFDSQSICLNHCSSFSRSCYKESVVGFKLIAAGKQKYLKETEKVDQQYQEIENEIIQRAQQQTKN